MFKYLTVIGREREQAGHGCSYVYSITDSCFEETVRPASAYHWHHSVVIEIIKLYKRRNLHVVRNLAAYYKYLEANDTKIHLVVDDHYSSIDKVDKNIQYKRLYYPLLFNNLLQPKY